MRTPRLAGARVVVLGLGRFGGGLGAVRWLCGQGAEVVVTDQADGPSLGSAADEAAAAGARLALGGHDGVDFGGADLLVVNPAVPLDAWPVRAAEAAGVPVTTEIALLIERWPGPIVGVTGSNGKSTTASLCHAILESAGADVVVGGNLGGSLLDRLETSTPQCIAVLELSSFMLEHLDRLGLGPDVAVITNITPNHLDRHGSLGAYRDAKAAVLHGARAAVMFADDPTVREVGGGFPGEALWYGSSGALVVEAGGDLVLRDHWRLPVARIPLLGHMNRCNLAAAILAASAVLGDEQRAADAAAGALSTFRPPPHRLATVGVHGDVRWIDDSVSTTPESTAASLEAVGGPCILIAGGYDKGLAPRSLVDAAARLGATVLTVGAQGPALVEALAAAGVPSSPMGTVRAAVRRAAELAQPGQAVLLSPGYASFDQIPSDYRERGRHFTAEVRLLAEARMSRGAEGC